MPKNSIEMLNYKIINKTNDEGEIIFYGQVVEQIPTDWFGDPIEGMYIALDDFMKDLEQIKNKDKLTIRLNSVGGDFNTGVVIHNLLKDLNAHKTGIIDGLAASAASVIACACDELQVFPSSRFMIHNAQAGLCGWFDEDGLQKIINRLGSCKTSMTQIYKDRSGKTDEEIQSLTKQETWYVGQEIIDAGFADVLISNENQDIKMKIENNGKILVANGIKHDISAYKNFPKEDLNIKEENFIEKVTNKVLSSLAGKQSTTGVGEDKNLVEEVVETPQNKTEREKEMCKNVEELRTAYPDLVAQVEKTVSEQAKTQASIDERKRIQEIEEVQASIGDTELIAKAKFGKDEEVMNAKDLAFIAMKNQQNQGADYLSNLEADKTAAKTDEVVTVPNTGAANGQSEEAQVAASLCDVFKATAEEKNGGIK